MKKRINLILDQFDGTQIEFGKSIGKSKQTISGWKNGRVPVSKSAAITIEKVHGYRREWLLTGKPPQKIPNQNAKKQIIEVDFKTSILKKLNSNKDLRGVVEILLRMTKGNFNLAEKIIQAFSESVFKSKKKAKI